MNTTNLSITSFSEQPLHCCSIVNIQLNGKPTSIMIDQQAFDLIGSSDRSMEAVFWKNFEYFKRKIIDYLIYNEATEHIKLLQKS